MAHIYRTKGAFVNSVKFAIRLLVITCVFIFSGCDGGKGKSVACGAGESAGPYGNCTPTSGQCPTGQNLQNGVCKSTIPKCPLGQHIENSQCTVDTVDCPTGQTEVNGLCINDPLQCPIGKHEENGECVPDPISCPEDQIDVEGECVANILSISIANQTACWVKNSGATRLITQYVVRDATGKTIDPLFNASNIPTALKTDLYVNAKPVDKESLIDLKSELLDSDLALSLVLDNSTSMLQHSPPAFEPMKNAAASILRKTQETWAANNSQFHWELSWFNNLIYRPLPNNAAEPWEIDDIINIPPPSGDIAFTGLYKAIAQMTDVHQQLYLDGFAAGERDQHIMVVFTDGSDNNSHFPNDDADHQITGSVNDTLLYEGFGYRAMARDELPAKFAAVPNLKVFVIGFSDEVKGQELLEIANQGGGRYFFSSNSTTLQTLFNAVQREFVTQLTIGADMPLETNEYLFTIKAVHLSTDIEGQISFPLAVGPGALPQCPE